MPRLFVCICHAVTDREIESAVRGQADSLDDVTAATGAGASCGTCHDAIEAMIEDNRVACPRRAGALLGATR